MKITKIVTNNIVDNDSGVCGEFSITLDDSLCIHKILVVNGKKGLFITFPNVGVGSDESGCKRYKDIVHPTNNSLRNYIQEEVIKYYKEVTA